MIVVELAGAGGVGKSTMAPLLAQQLRDQLGETQVAAMPEKKGIPRSQRHWTRINRWLWTIKHPSSILVAWKASRTTPRIARYSAWMRAFTSVGIARKAASSGLKVAMIDQGLMRLPMLPQHAALVPKSFMPDVILHMVADPAVLEMRRIYRSKVKHNKYSGEARILKALETLDLLHQLPEGELRDALEKFGAKFCEPALSEAEITQVLTAPKRPPQVDPSAERKIGRCDPDVCEMIRQAGVAWREIDNSEQDGLNKALQASMTAILEFVPDGKTGV